MMTNEINLSKTLDGLGAYIIELDSFRPPLMFGVSPLSFTGTLELLFKSHHKSYFIKKNPEINQKIKKEMHNYRYDTKIDPEEMKVPLILISAIIFFTVAIVLGITVIYSLNIFQISLLVFVIALPLLYVFFSYVVPKRRNVVGERHDEELKRSVQLLIDFGVQFCTDNNLNQDMFPIKLRHDDYAGLVYEKKGKNNFVGFLKK